MPKRILIVDDSESTRSIIREIIKPLGYPISEAEDGNHAIESIRQGGIDGMILDLLMPDRDGLEVLVWLKRERPDLPVVVITVAGKGLDDISYPAIAERFGAIKAFEKPITKDMVLEAVELLAASW
ncbi:MAG: response regulator [Rhodospirillales bacterium]|nr:response regulator [Rhodospirillales bacterium]